MFTGIIESVGIVKQIDIEVDNISFWIESDISNELKVDQSVSHNGVCLTVVDTSENLHKVTAIKETLNKTNFKKLKVNSLVNLERCLVLNSRLDGHIVQGHVDQVGHLTSIKDENGSYMLTIQYEDNSGGNVTVEKGSICVNGVSLTVVNSKLNKFSLAIIPYTWNFTNLKDLKVGDLINLEFDILGKYINRLLKL